MYENKYMQGKGKKKKEETLYTALLPRIYK